MPISVVAVTTVKVIQNFYSTQGSIDITNLIILLEYLKFLFANPHRTIVYIIIVTVELFSYIIMR